MTKTCIDILADNCRYWNDPDAMAKFGKAFKDMPGMEAMLGGAPASRSVGEDVAGDQGSNDGDEDASELIAASMDGDVERVKAAIKAGGDGVHSMAHCLL